MTKDELMAKIELKFGSIMSDSDREWLRDLHMAQLVYIYIKLTA